MIKKSLLLSLFLGVQLGFAQQVTLSKAEKISDRTDKFLYKVDSSEKEKVYLGELEIQEYAMSETDLFDKIYKKAKSIGANAFELKSLETIDQSPYKLNRSHYYLNLYEVAKKPVRDNKVYLISSSDKPIKVRINNKVVVLEPKSYIESELVPGDMQSISVGRLLGSKINLSYKEGQPVQYFLILPAGVRANHASSEGGLNFKSGDIVNVERSFAEFLTTIYPKQN